MKSIAVIGQGFVGGSLATVFAEKGFNVYVYDKAGKVAPGAIGLKELILNSSMLSSVDKPSIPTLAKLVEEVCGASFPGIYFVCLPTPMLPDGSADVSIVENALAELASVPGERIAVIKSTVPPGTTQNWNKMFNDKGLTVIFNPEFLTEANALNDMRNQNRIVLGGPRPRINSVKILFQTAFPSVPIIKTSSTTAEMVKYVTNIHLAVKVALANEFYQICSSLDEQGANIDYDKVIEYALHDERLGRSHWRVPGPMPSDDTGEPAFGFGGSCFVKDINALISVSRSLGIDPKVMKGAWEKNLEVRPQRDWEKLKGRAVSNKGENNE